MKEGEEMNRHAGLHYEEVMKKEKLKDWDGIRENVKEGLKKLGHDIKITCE